MMLELLPPPKKVKLQKLTSLDELWVLFVRLRGEIVMHTKLKYGVVGRKFCNFMRDRPLTPQSMVEWMLYLQDEKLEPSTIGSIQIKVMAFLKFLKTMNYTETDLRNAMPRSPRIPIKEAKMFTEEEFERIKEWCTGKNKYQLHLWLIILGYRTGMSLVDCCHLRWCNVVLVEDSHSYIDIYRIKTVRLGMKALCQIPILAGTDVHEWLLRLKAVEHLNYSRFDGITDFVHQDAPGYYSYTNSRIQDAFTNIFRGCGIEGRTFRNLRNSFCSNLINSGTQIALACKMTGHNNVQMLLRYLKADRRALADGLARSFQYSAAQAGIGKGSDPIRDNL